jgi:hypothetical protein
MKKIFLGLLVVPSIAFGMENPDDVFARVSRYKFAGEEARKADDAAFCPCVVGCIVPMIVAATSRSMSAEARVVTTAAATMYGVAINSGPTQAHSNLQRCRRDLVELIGNPATDFSISNGEQTFASALLDIKDKDVQEALEKRATLNALLTK